MVMPRNRRVSSKSLHSINDWMFGFVDVKSAG